MKQKDYGTVGWSDCKQFEGGETEIVQVIACYA